MLTRSWMSGLATMAAGLALMACAETGMIDEGEAEGSGPSDAEETIIPDTTKVLAPEARDALVSYDRESGTLRFSLDSAGVGATEPHQVADPSELEAGDVVVSEPTTAAPYGVLRRVTDVIAGPEAIEVLTVPAGLEEAIEQGGLEKRLPMDAAEVHVTQPGVGLTVLPQENDTNRDLLGFSVQLPYQLDLPIGFDFGTGGACTLTQASKIGVNASALLGLEINNAKVTRFGVFGAANATGKLNIQCNQSAVNTTLTLGQIISPVYVDYIGPVPVVFQFGLAVAGGVSGTTNGLTVNAEWSEGYNAGLGWKSDTGWGPEIAHTATPLSWDARGNGTLRFRQGPIFVLSIFSGDVFSFFDWVDIGFSIGATGAVYGLPFLEVAGAQDLENGTGSATLSAGLESGGAAGAFVSIDVSTLGWTLFSETWSWVHSEVFPEIKNVLASVTY